MFKLDVLLKNAARFSKPEKPDSEIETRLWRRVFNNQKGEELARRVWPQELKGWTTKPIAVEEGTRGVMYSNGKNIGELGPGRHDLAGLKKKFATLDFHLVENISMFVTSDFFLVFGYDNLPTASTVATESDKSIAISADVNAKLYFNISDPGMFLTNLMKNHEVIYEKDIADLVEREIGDIIRTEMGNTKFVDALRNLDVKHKLERAIISSLSNHFANLGISVVAASSISFYSKEYEELSGMDQQAAIMAYTTESNTRFRKMKLAEEINELKFQQESEEEKRKLAFNSKINEIQQVNEFNKRVIEFKSKEELEEYIQEFEKKHKINEIRTEYEKQALLRQARNKEELDKLRDEIEKDNLLRNEDKDELKHMIAMKQEERNHKLEKLMLENEDDLTELKLKNDDAIKDEKLKAKIKELQNEQEKSQLEHEQNLAKMKRILANQWENEDYELKRQRYVQEIRDEGDLGKIQEDAKTEKLRSKMQLFKEWQEHLAIKRERDDKHAQWLEDERIKREETLEEKRAERQGIKDKQNHEMAVEIKQLEHQHTIAEKEIDNKHNAAVMEIESHTKIKVTELENKDESGKELALTNKFHQQLMDEKDKQIKMAKDLSNESKEDLKDVMKSFTRITEISVSKEQSAQPIIVTSTGQPINPVGASGQTTAGSKTKKIVLCPNCNYEHEIPSAGYVVNFCNNCGKKMNPGK